MATVTSTTAGAQDAPFAPKGCSNLKLKQASRLVSRHYEAHFADTGLRINQYSLLSCVALMGPVRSGELAATMRLDASTLTRNLQPLVDRALVRVEVGDDQRSRVITATPEGLALRTEAQRAWKKAQLALNQKLGVERVAALHALLDECVALLGEEGESDDE